MELDFFFPDLKLAVEYQGAQHFIDIHVFAPQRAYAFRDQQKRKACLQENITLIEIPYWWDFNEESLRATIHHQRPDLLPRPISGAPIPSKSPYQSQCIEVKIM
jgi:hypothetical protein